MEQKPITDFINGKVIYDKHSQYFFVRQSNGHEQILGELRGWGHIQNMFFEKKPHKDGKFDLDAAAIFQDRLGEFVVTAINEKIERVGVVENFAYELTKEPLTEALNKHNVSGSNFCDLISAHIKERNERIIKAMQVEIDCNHKWDEYGHGYKCSECGFYTGMNSTLNMLIDQSLTH